MSNQHKRYLTITDLDKLGFYIVSVETFTHSQFQRLCCMSSELEPAKIWLAVTLKPYSI